MTPRVDCYCDPRADHYSTHLLAPLVVSSLNQLLTGLTGRSLSSHLLSSGLIPRAYAVAVPLLRRAGREGVRQQRSQHGRHQRGATGG